MEKIYVSREGLEKMKADLAECKERRLKVAEVIEQARAFGDLRENAEYHAAKEAQAMLHARIKDLEDKIARAEVLDNQAIDSTKVYLGARVKVFNEKMKREFDYTLVGPVEADMASGKISIQSPVGKALLGLSVGDVAVAKVPAGDVRFKILEISR